MYVVITAFIVEDVIFRFIKFFKYVSPVMIKKVLYICKEIRSGNSGFMLGADNESDSFCGGCIL